MQETEARKPDPLYKDGRFCYTLTSYDPVSVEVEVRDVTNEAVDAALQFAMIQMGGGPERLLDDAWIQSKFPGAANSGQLKNMIRAKLEAASAELTRQNKANQCAIVLSERLVEQIPQIYITGLREVVRDTFLTGLVRQEMTVDDYLKESEITMAELEKMINHQTMQTAMQEAALDAWADKFEIVVEDEEVPDLLPAKAPNEKRTLEELVESGRLEEGRISARRVKALHDVIRRSECTYKHVAGFTGGIPSGPATLTMV